MKRILAALIITIAVPTLAFTQAKSKHANSNKRDERMFRKLEREMFDVFEGKPNLDAIDRLYAEDFFTINADGRTANKQQTIESLRSGQFQVDQITSDEFRVRRYGDTAVITGHSAYFKGGQKVGEVRHTQIWVKRNGRWQLVGWQGTPLGEVRRNNP